MAKASQQLADSFADSADESCSLAERLFAANWNPSSGYTPESIADKCLDAAEAFERVRRKRAELRIAQSA